MRCDDEDTKGGVAGWRTCERVTAARVRAGLRVRLRQRSHDAIAAKMIMVRGALTKCGLVVRNGGMLKNRGTEDAEGAEYEQMARIESAAAAGPGL